MPDMFKPYNPTAVPDVMPFPPLGRVSTTKAEHTPVPKLNKYQRSWIFDVALRGQDLPNMPQGDVKDFFEKVKTDAFEAKAFQHTVQPGDATEEACLPARITSWLAEHPQQANNNQSKKKAKKSGDGNDSDTEEDAGARVGLLGGYPKAGWCLSIQKVLTNKRGAEKKVIKRGGTSAEKTDVIAQALALAKVFGIATQNGRDKFREEHRYDIRDLSKTLPGANAGGNSRKAEAQLWVQEDHEEWAAAATTEKDVNWTERQQFVTGGVQHMVETLNAGGKFRPFLATMVMSWLDEHDELCLGWVEALPQGVHVHQRFEDQYPQVTTGFINAMHGWAKQLLQEYAATRDGPLEPAAPVFALTVEALNDMSPNSVAQAAMAFLIKSYQAAFGDEVISWATIIASKLEEYYDTSKFNDVVFTADGPQGVKGAEWFVLGAALAAGAGEGSSGFFRKVPDVGSGEQEENSADADEQCKAEADVQRQAEEAEVQCQAEETDVEAEAKHKEEDAEAKHKVEAKRKAEEAQARADEQQTVVEEPKKKDWKRKAAEAELQPEAEGEPGNPLRQLPSFSPRRKVGSVDLGEPANPSRSEAEAERQEKAETAKNKSKARPGWEYVTKTRVKAPKRKR
ncbi:hypothetical protein C8F04DRAFT_1252645 [Mycena alexandri]|uniref:Uncharacterized protein n=1 Tax=Mycena alexandri TaxID=1745969 RepID=A0AAD6T9Y1_9AGAR|nr:hypothetical protein C8F04DRAFT_1252645 [Mycena alexandri]